jgi:PAS domain S-box-containing protein
MRHTLEQISQNLHQPVVVTDSLGKVLWVNEWFTNMCGHQTAELVGKTPGSVLQGPDTSPATIAKIGHAVRNHESFHGTILNYHADGHTYWVDLNISPIKDTKDQLQCFIAIEREIPPPLHDMATICMYCKNYKNPANGDWVGIEKLLTQMMNQPPSHGICPDCMQRAFQESP